VPEEVERASVGQCGRPGPGFTATASNGAGGRLGPGGQGGRLRDKARWRRHKRATRRLASTYVASRAGRQRTDQQTLGCLGASAAWEGMEPRDGVVLGWRDLERRPEARTPRVGAAWHARGRSGRRDVAAPVCSSVNVLT
jgi:hypothetical protein